MLAALGLATVFRGHPPRIRRDHDACQQAASTKLSRLSMARGRALRGLDSEVKVCGVSRFCESTAAIDSFTTEGCSATRPTEAAKFHHVVFTATSLNAKTFDEWSTGKGEHLLGLDPVQQAPIGDYLSELVQLLGSPSHSNKILTIEINDQISIMEGRSHFLQHIEHLTVRLGPCFCAEDTSPLIDLIRCKTRLQTLDVQFSSCSRTSDTSFWALKQILQMPNCTSTSLRHFCLVNAATLVDDLVGFVQRQSLVQEIVLADPLIVQHNENATLAMEPTHSFWSHHAHSMRQHGRYVEVSITYL